MVNSYTLERGVQGITAWWTDDDGHLRHQMFIGFTMREIRYEMAKVLRGEAQ